MFVLNWYFLEGIPEQRDTMNDIAGALKLLAMPGNVLKRFELTIGLEHPGDAASGEEEQMYLPRRWFDQWVALDDVLSDVQSGPLPVF